MRGWARDARDSLIFHLNPPSWDDVLSEDLPFGPDAETTFLELLASCRHYLEYGAGSSTFAAARAGVPLVSVESDPRFLAAVERRCRFLAPSGGGEMRFLHGDIGWTGPWGKPVVPVLRRPAKWRHYSMAPWHVLGEQYRADLVLIDGRFRVACALAVIAHQPDSSWTLLVDDYVGREEYTAIAHFTELVALHGRMAQFQPRSGIPAAEIALALDRFIGDWR